MINSLTTKLIVFSIINLYTRRLKNNKFKNNKICLSISFSFYNIRLNIQYQCRLQEFLVLCRTIFNFVSRSKLNIGCFIGKAC